MTFAMQKASVVQSKTGSSIRSYRATSSGEATSEFLAGSLSNTLVLKKPLLVSIEQAEDDSFVVSDDQFGVYGVGATKFQAQLDYMTSLADYYEILSSRANTNAANGGLFKHLCEHVSRR
jgi:hypothetical protein